MADRLLGEWWNPNDVSKKYPGILTISDNQRPRLELLAQVGTPEFDGQPLLHGIAGGAQYSLLNLTKFMHSMVLGSMWTLNEVWIMRFALKGLFVDSPDAKFENVTFTVEGIQDWTEISGIRRTLTQAYGSLNIDTRIEHVHPDPIMIAIRGIEFFFSPSLNHPNKRWSVSLEEDTQVFVHSKESKTLPQWWADVVTPIQRLVQFSVKTGGTINRTAVTSDAFHNAEAPIENRWHDVISSWSEKYKFDDNRSGFERPILKLSDFSENSQRLIRWCDLYEKYKEPFDGLLRLDPVESTLEYSYFVTVRLLERLVERYPSHDLITKLELERAIEAVRPVIEDEYKQDAFIHKMRSMGRRNSQAPVSEALKRWCVYTPALKDDPDFQKWVVAKIVDTRNCFAHHSESACQNTSSGDELVVLRALVRTLVDFEVGDQLGIPTDRIADRLKDSYQMRTANEIGRVWADRQD